MWVAAALSAGLLELPFPLAGPMPPWRSIFAWFALVPLFWALLSPAHEVQSHPLRRAFFIAYICGVLWYLGNCYWIYNTMQIHGELPPLISAVILILFSTVLGLYFGLFGLAVKTIQRTTGSVRIALGLAPLFWTGLDLAASRVTSVPWDQLGYSQVDNVLINQVAAFTGVYGITFVLVMVNALFAGALLLGANSNNRLTGRWGWAACGSILFLAGFVGIFVPPPTAHPTASAVLIQPDLDVEGTGFWLRPGEWDSHIAQFAHLADEQCKTYIAGIPQTGAPIGQIICPPYPTHPDLVVWPESPAPFFQQEQRFQNSMAVIARETHAPLVVNGVGSDFLASKQVWQDHVSAIAFSADGNEVGRYDKIHLVPWGEFVPYPKIFFFARKLTGKVAHYTRGIERNTLLLEAQDGQRHRYGVFICYEAVFADEVRHFARNGAEVLVNISDDGWYGDTSAPWQHLNMARMRAVENRRWLLRDTNNGVTAAIDPYGRVRESIPRHQADALQAHFGFRSDITFYADHGDIFGWMCTIFGTGILVWVKLKERIVALQPGPRPSL